MKLIKDMRKAAGISQNELAKLLNVTQTAVSKWENDDNFPSVKRLPQLAQVLDCTVDELLGSIS